MIKHTERELAVTASAMWKFVMQQTTNKIVSEEPEVSGIKIIGEEESNVEMLMSYD